MINKGWRSGRYREGQLIIDRSSVNEGNVLSIRKDADHHTDIPQRLHALREESRLKTCEIGVETTASLCYVIT